ncbi:Phosphoribosyl 1,2-cyclic phosphate phosphodiesterase [Dyadobacter sp. CECT 9275]|uniref:Phosphoribosyl 1,2-cyclic phosphate phosphodiesterase n=1 Tax=Dyadobacter helix TaxID=2822344 RepID=A0A916JAC9_9BACT|nr:MBL fold metallo-hydrolase [Dyadobacter sp. CECT 9275]CAG4994957.1 Phosphoribosyl 1,2-cyclic phosphate phosphodiesterase [Dyadobacter sp. CECT 9275]
MKITLLGTGTSQGIPVIACDCAVCRSEDPRDKRLRVSVWIQTKNRSFVIDAGPDFRQQMLRANVRSLDAILFTHQHKDHTAGLDDSRAFNHRQQKDIPLYGRAEVLNQIRTEFSYAFSEFRYPGVPQFEMHYIENKPFSVEGITFLPIEVMHHKLPVFGFRIGDFTYITDVNFISEEEQEKIKGTKVLVLDTLQKEPHLSHFTLPQSLDLIDKLNVPQAYLTHISHKLGRHADVEKELPPHVRLAFDGMEIEL